MWLFLKDKIIEIKINGYNKKPYEKVLNQELNKGEVVHITQGQVLKTSRTLVYCECDNCGCVFQRKRIDVGDSKKTFCGVTCRNKGFENPNPKKEKIKVSCSVCLKGFEVTESKFKRQEYFLCSRECYARHRSVHYSGENTYNYQDIYVECAFCKQAIKTTNFELENRNVLFCTQNCYWSYRKENYRELYFLHNKNKNRKETTPETLFREYLEKNDIRFKQEVPIDNIYYADFFLEDFDLIVEIYGDYWHSNPNIYGEAANLKPRNNIQKEVLKRDKRKEGYYKHKNKRFIILWESEIHEDIGFYLKNKIKEIDLQFNLTATTIRQTP